MYVYDQGRTSGAPLGIGRLDAFGKRPKHKEGRDAKKVEDLERLITRLSTERNWDKLDHYYREWFKVQVKGKWQIYKMAAEAAKYRGDALSRYHRVTTALNLLKLAGGQPDQRKTLEKEREDLEVNWALVDIHLRRPLKSPIIYPAPGRILRRGDGATAFEWASEKLSKTRKFKGLLPIGPFGHFSIDGQEISLEDNCALYRASLVTIRQEGDGTFAIDCDPRPPQIERNPPTRIEWTRQILAVMFS